MPSHLPDIHSFVRAVTSQVAPTTHRVLASIPQHRSRFFSTMAHPTRFGFDDSVSSSFLEHEQLGGAIRSSGGSFGVDDRKHIFKGASDVRDYCTIHLKNGLRCVLISDPSAEKAAAALSVAVGHLSDPQEAAGLAHAVEHMCFLGSDKYPDEGAYKAFLKSHGGGSNASTGPEATTYHFFVHPDSLPQALDMFAGFFVDPLFTESATGRELNAINSENEASCGAGRRA